MPRRVLVLVAMLVAALAVGTTPATAESRQVPVRVMNLNMHTGIGSDGVLDLARTAATIRDSGADIVGLEEVDVHWDARSDFRDQASDLARALKMWVFFAPIYDLPPNNPGEPRRQYGVAVLSRYPIVHTENHWITRLSTQDPNPVPKPAPGFAEAVVLICGTLVHVYATHLDYRPEPEVRAMQVADTREILGADRPGATQLLLGDFNATPDAAELAPLWDTVHDTWPADAGPGPTYPAAAPEKRIDYVTASSRVETRGAEVVDTLTSDHRPVLADLTVPGVLG